jgi:hypothetical protein
MVGLIEASFTLLLNVALEGKVTGSKVVSRNAADFVLPSVFFSYEKLYLFHLS